jgi:hypothetical protein
MIASLETNPLNIVEPGVSVDKTTVAGFTQADAVTRGIERLARIRLIA